MAGVTRPLSFVLLALLGACAGNVAMVQGDVYRPGVPGEFAYAAGGRDLATVVIGNPFSVSKETLDGAVTDAMQGHHSGPPTNFTTRPSASARRQFRMVIMFNPPRSLAGGALCGETGASRPAESDGRLRLIVAFCQRELILSEARGVGPAPDSPGDAAFRRLIAAATREVVPDIDPYEDLDE